MATAPYVESLLGGLDRNLRRALRAGFEYILANLRFGRPTVGERTENFQLYTIEGTTASIANTEFSVAHNLSSAPYLALPVLDLQAVNSMTPRLKVTRAADASRVYLSSPDTSSAFTLLIEV